MISWSNFLLFSVFLFLLLPISVSYTNAETSDEIAAALTRAEELSVSSFEAVLEAEQAGANVSGLLNRLNLAGETLAEAYFFYNSGVYENATYFVNLCCEILEDVMNEAIELNDETKSLMETNLVVTFVMSSVSVVIVVVLCYFTWMVFRRRYLRCLLRSRPEVGSNEP